MPQTNADVISGSEQANQDALEARQDAFQVPEVGVPGPSRRPYTASDEDGRDNGRESTRTSDDVKPAVGDALSKTLEALNQRIAGETNDARLLADPNIRAYLEARQKGVKTKFVMEDEIAEQRTAVPPPASVPPPNFDEMSNADLVKFQTDTLTKTLESAVERAVASRMGEYEKRVAPRIANAEAAANVVVQRDLQAQLADSRKKYKDFDALMPTISQLNKVVSGVTVEELYHLAKLRAGTPPMNQQQLETERPSDIPRNRTPSPRRPSSIVGASGFDAILRRALDSKENIGRDE